MVYNPSSPLYQQQQQQRPGGNSLAPGASSSPTSSSPVNGPAAPSGTVPATPNSGSQSSSGGTANTAGVTSQAARNDQVYDPSNPIRALRNALAARGIYNQSGPMMQYMMKFAPGLSNLFYLQGATGDSGYDMEQARQSGGISTLFEQFLGKALGNPGGGLTGFMQTNGGTGNTQSLLERVSQANAEYQKAGGGGNPFLDQFANATRQSGGSSDILASLNAPFMGSYGRAYSQGLQGAEDRAANSDWLWGGDPNRSVFEALLRQLYGGQYGQYAAPYGR